jgi:hypothetical protein
MVLSTYNEHGGASALIRANAETGDLKVLDYTPPGHEYYFNTSESGTTVPNTSLFAYTAKDKIILYDIFTLDKIEYPLRSGRKDKGPYYWGIAGATCDGKHLLIPYNDYNLDWDEPADIRNKKTGNSLFMMEIKSGKMWEVHRDDKTQNNHVIANPANPDYCIIDKDFPPYYWGGGDHGKTTRVWVLHIPSGKLTEIRPNDECKFAHHANWNHDGTHVYYQGGSFAKSLRGKTEETDVQEFINPYRGDNPHFIGVADMNGKVVWEAVFPSMYYGHVGAHTTKDMMLIENLVTDRYIVGLDWRELNHRGMPKMEKLIITHFLDLYVFIVLNCISNS